MPQTNQHLTDQDFVGSTESEDTGTPYGHVEGNEYPQFTSTLEHTPTAATTTTAHSFHPSYPSHAVHGPMYPQYSSFFDFNEAGTTPTESLIANSDARFAIPTAGNDFSWSQSDAWDSGNTSGFAIDTNMSSSSALMQHAPMQFPWDMNNNYEPMVNNTAWSVAGSSPFSTHESPTSARPSSQNIGRTSPSRSRRPSIARYHSSSTTYQLSPASTIVEPMQQQHQQQQQQQQQLEQRTESIRPNKRRKSGLERREREESQQYPSSAATPTPLALSAVPTPSPKDNTIVVPDHGTDSYSQPHTSPQQHRELPVEHQQQNPNEYSKPQPQSQSQPSFAPPRQQPPLQQQQQQPPQALRERNRAAANKCRRKSKAVVADLEATERDLAEEHRQLSQTAGSLREEVLALKSSLLVHGHCEDEVIQQYFANSARLVGSGQQVGQPQRGQSSFLTRSSSRGRQQSGFGNQEGSQGEE
ncbi:Transcription factor atf21 [Cytospora mali]|uniref:Transcription factor atf21 n=1 Tax=Cytospora mali TaxID=578113 RepID=A0A194UXM0_CYTMA|nr:Transcription factor atf21 [Valsa mali var. pyri (nom. inval.)]